MKTYTYIDNSNVYIEGSRIAAVKNEMARNIVDAMNNHKTDFSWQLDYGKLHMFLCGNNKNEIGAARFWGSPPPSDTFWKMVKRKGFDVKTYEKSHGKEKKVDVAIAHRMTKDAYTIIDKTTDEITLVATLQFRGRRRETVHFDRPYFAAPLQRIVRRISWFVATRRK